MDDEIMTLAGDFPAVTHDQWLAAVDEVLRGRDFAEVLLSTTPDGLEIAPLYTLDDERDPPQVPGVGVSRRASGVAGLTAGWDVRQRHGLAGPTSSTGELNAAILTDLERGVTSVELVTDWIGDVDTLDAVLDGVLLDLAPVGLVGPGDGLGSARHLLELADHRRLPPGTLEADLGCDPIGNWARTGAADGDVRDALAAVGAFGAELASGSGRLRVVRADGAIYAEAGATPATELATTIATGVAYLRAIVDAGVDVERALGQILLSVSVGTDQFAEMAKLRALRVMWARVGEATGAEPVPARVQAGLAEIVMTRRDPWVNMLRGTIGCFAAATGGADIVLVRPFDSIVGAPDELGFRVARNTQLALLEESNLHRVIDPAGGSWYMESLTDALAHRAWALFREIEREGGMVAALQSGWLQDRIEHAAADTAAQVAHRRRPITGVSEFPDLDEAALERRRLEAPPTPGAPSIRPVAPRRVAAGYEALRDTAEAAASEPRIFSANLGPVATHTGRAMWARNLFAAGGIRVSDNDGFDDAAEVADAFGRDGAELAVICSSDALLADRGEATARALRDAGARHVYLVGEPGHHEGRFRAAGVDEFLHDGCDVLAVLTRAHELLGLATKELS